MNRSETSAAETAVEEFERGRGEGGPPGDPVNGTGTATNVVPTDALFTALYHELHRMAERQLRGGGVHDITLSAADRLVPVDQRPDPDVLEALSEALDELARMDPSLAQLVDLHFFCGFSLQEIAAARGVSDRTVQRDWRKARLLLHRLLDADAAASRTLEDGAPHARS